MQEPRRGWLNRAYSELSATRKYPLGCNVVELPGRPQTPRIRRSSPLSGAAAWHPQPISQKRTWGQRGRVHVRAFYAWLDKVILELQFSSSANSGFPPHALDQSIVN